MRQTIVEENTLSATHEKRDNEKIKEIAESATEGDFNNEIVVIRLCFL